MSFFLGTCPPSTFVFLSYSSSVIPVYHIIVRIKTWVEACYTYRCVHAFPTQTHSRRKKSCPSKGLHFIACFSSANMPQTIVFAIQVVWLRLSGVLEWSPSCCARMYKKQNKKLHRTLTFANFQKDFLQMGMYLSNKFKPGMLVKCFPKGERKTGKVIKTERGT